MAQNFKEYLREEFDRAVKEFEKAKEEAAAEILSMTHFTAVDFGAAYASHIDKVTAAAAKLRAIAEFSNTYDYFEKRKED